MSRLLAAPSLVLVAVFASACTAETTSPAPEESTGEVAQALDDDDDDCLAGRPGHRIEDIVAEQGAAFNAHNAAAFAATFTPTARHVGPNAVLQVGPAALQAQHNFLFSPVGPFRAASEARTTLNITCLRPRVAIVDLDVALTGYAGLQPGLVPTTPGVFRTYQRLVVVKENREWLVQAQQLTPVLPPPPAPPPAP